MENEALVTIASGNVITIVEQLNLVYGNIQFMKKVNKREPLATKNVNVATVRPTLSKLPALTPRSRLPTPGMKQKHTFSVCAEKRKASGSPHAADKKICLNLSMSSDVSSSSDLSTVSSLSGRSSASKRATVAVSRGKVVSRVAGTNVARGTAVGGRRPVPVSSTARKIPGSVAAKLPPRPGSASAKPPTTTTTKTNASGVGGGKKRAAWDLKGRLQDMEAAMTQLLKQKENLEMETCTSGDRLAQMEALNNKLQGAVVEKDSEAQTIQQRAAHLQQQLRDMEDDHDRKVKKLQRDISDAEFERETINRQKQTLESELAAVRQEAAGLRSTVASLSAAQEGIRAELSSVKLLLEAAQEASRSKDGQITDLKEVVKAQNETMEEMTVKMREHEASRRKLHNTIQELKGNIRVFCRVRPLLGDEISNDEDPTTITHMNFPDDDGKVVELEKLNDASPNESTLSGKKGKYDFAFDRVFPPTSTQSVVFEEISQLVQSALDGYNVCIFAYGQTGSGKTFTMEGAADGDNPDLMGMIPRAVEQIFRSAADLKEKGWEYEVEVSFLEIYNETIRDLLGNGRDNVKHDIRMVAANSSEVTVSGLTHVKVLTERKISDLLRKASENRAVAETKCNKRSSRSHSVFCMKLTGRNKHTEETTLGLLNLIDLAGSERLKDSGSQGARLKETQSINSSLANLGNVIMALANKESHIPYRNSKLTHLLQNCLGGSSKTLMFVNVSPKEECFSETLNSLRFATKVNNCNIGTAQKQAK